jgi:hypothetical protein
MSHTFVEQHDTVHLTGKAFFDHYRCPESFARFRLTGAPSRESGYFRFGPRAICYGKCSTGFRAARATDELYDVLQDVVSVGQTIGLPFNPSEVVANLRHERYLWNPVHGGHASTSWSAFKGAYYQVRPLLPKAVRRRLQRAYFKGWREIAFPRWPVDSTVEEIFETQVALSLRAHLSKACLLYGFGPTALRAA